MTSNAASAQRWAKSATNIKHGVAARVPFAHDLTSQRASRAKSWAKSAKEKSKETGPVVALLRARPVVLAPIMAMENVTSVEVLVKFAIKSGPKPPGAAKKD